MPAPHPSNSTDDIAAKETPRNAKRLIWPIFALAGASNIYLLYALLHAMPGPTCSHRDPCGREQAARHAPATVVTRPPTGLAALESGR